MWWCFFSLLPLNRFHRYKILERLPASVRRRLEEGVKGTVPETPKQSDPCFSKLSNVLVGSADTAAKAARRSLRKAGFEVRIFSNQISGEAREYVLHMFKNIF